MRIDINLVSKSTSERSRELRIVKIRTVSFVTLFFVALSSLVIFLINFRFSVNFVKNQQNSLIAELSVYDETASRIFLLNNRLADISSILGSRKKYNEVAYKIIENQPSSITVEEFKIGKDGIVVGVSSNSLLELSNFVNHMLDLNKKKVIQNVVLDNLSSDSSLYLMTIKAK